MVSDNIISLTLKKRLYSVSAGYKNDDQMNKGNNNMVLEQSMTKAEVFIDKAPRNGVSRENIKGRVLRREKK